MQLHRKALHSSRMLADVILLIISFSVAQIIIPFYGKTLFNTFDLLFIIVLVITWFFSSRITYLYDEFRSRSFSFELINVIKNVLIQALAAVVFIFFSKEIFIPRLFVILYSVLLVISIASVKYLIRKLLIRYRRKGRNLRSVLIIGAGPVGLNFYDSIYQNPHFGYNMIGFLDDEQKEVLNGQYLGKINDLENILEKRNIDAIIVALPNYAAEKIEQVITVCQQYPTKLMVIPDYFKFFSNKYNVSLFGKFPIISVREDRLNQFHWRFLKRAFDTGMTLLLFLFVFLWLYPVIAIAIKLTSKGPIFFKQERWGRNNRKFIVYKFRTMSCSSSDIDENGKYNQAKKGDYRITKVGKFLRRTNLDELPQFMNVLAGQMSLVGPRPHPTPLNLESKEYIKNYMVRHLVKPGLTGWAQVNGFRGETEDLVKMQKRVELDLWYIENWSIWLDPQIFFLTIWNMFRGNLNAH